MGRTQQVTVSVISLSTRPDLYPVCEVYKKDESKRERQREEVEEEMNAAEEREMSFIHSHFLAQQYLLKFRDHGSRRGYFDPDG